MNWADESLIQGDIFNKQAALSRLGGDEELYQELLVVFLSELSELLAEVYSSLDSGNLHSIAEAVHTLKGAAANLGSERISSYCQKVEKWCREGNSIDDPGAIKVIFIRLQKEIEENR